MLFTVRAEFGGGGSGYKIVGGEKDGGGLGGSDFPGTFLPDAGS